MDEIDGRHYTIAKFELTEDVESKDLYERMHLLEQVSKEETSSPKKIDPRSN